MLTQIEDLPDDKLRLFTLELHKYTTEKSGNHLTTCVSSNTTISGPITEKSQSYTSNSAYKIVEHNKPRKKTRQESIENSDVATENRFNAFTDENMEGKDFQVNSVVRITKTPEVKDIWSLRFVLSLNIKTETRRKKPSSIAQCHGCQPGFSPHLSLPSLKIPSPQHSNDSPSLLTRLLGNATTTKHLATLTKILPIDITSTFLELLPNILTLLMDRRIKKPASLRVALRG
ncbi:hypothetical protein ILUMI_08357, partial [Ignelater luminosus]